MTIGIEYLADDHSMRISILTRNAQGRLERVAITATGAPIIVENAANHIRRADPETYAMLRAHAQRGM